MNLRRFRQFLPDLLAALVLVVLPPLVFWQTWTPNLADRRMFSGDILMGAYPTRVFVHRLFALGTAPLWNPYQLGGMPLLGDVQVAPYYLPNLLFDLVYRGRDLTYIGFELLVIGHYALGALFLYAYLRNLGVGPAAALIGAIAFEFNGFFVGHRGHYNMLAVVVWLPGVMWLLDRAWHAPRLPLALGWAVLAGLALSQMVMAGHPQLTLYCSLLLLAYFGYRWATALHAYWDEGWWARLYVPVLFGLAGMLAAGLSAIQLLPAAELLGRSLRSGLSYEFAAQYALLPRNVVGLLVPEFLGWSTTEYRIYAGVLTLLLASVAWVVPARARPEQRFFSLAALAALITALGAFTVLHGLVYRFVPGFESIRVSVRAFFLANLALCVLAAFGAEQLLGSLDTSALRRLTILARGASMFLGIAILLGVLFYALLLSNYRPVGEEFFFAENLFGRDIPGDAYGLLTQAANAYLLFVLLLTAAIGLLWGRLGERLMGQRLAFAAALLMFVDVATFAPYHDTIIANPETARFTIRKYATTMLDAPWQIADQQQLIDRLQQLPDGIRVDNTAEVLPDNFSAVWRMAFATGYNILDLQERFKLLTQWPNLPDAIRRDVLNIGYVMTAADDANPPEENARLLVENSQGKLWERAQQPQYARFSTRIRPAAPGLAVNGLLNAAPSLDAQPLIALDGGKLHQTLEQLWPEALNPALFQIGTTGTASPVDITVLAGGPIKYSAVLIDGVTVTPEQRGIVLALIDPTSGRLLAAGGYDTYLSADESDRLAAEINAAPAGTIVALATYDEGIAKLNTAARNALASVGAQADLTDKVGAAYALIGVKGSPAGSALEQLDPAQAVTLDVGVGALPAQTGATFTSTLLTYQSDRVTLLAQNNTRGLLSISEAVFPGWQAYVDGLPAPTLRVNGLQRAVILPPALDGRPHEVTFVYRPLSARLGAAVSLLSLTLALGMLAALVATQFEWSRLQGWGMHAPTT